MCAYIIYSSCIYIYVLFYQSTPLQWTHTPFLAIFSLTYRNNCRIFSSLINTIPSQVCSSSAVIIFLTFVCLNITNLLALKKYQMPGCKARTNGQQSVNCRFIFSNLKDDYIRSPNVSPLWCISVNHPREVVWHRELLCGVKMVKMMETATWHNLYFIVWLRVWELHHRM